LREEVIRLASAGADYMHMDVMDGAFVPNFGLGSEVFNIVRENTTVPMDVHLMIRNPARHIEFFRRLGAEIICVHPESCQEPRKTLAQIRDTGAKAGIALNPETPVEFIAPLIPLCDHILAMTVNPGFAGQDYLESTNPKLAQLGELSARHGFTLCVDGNINPQRVRDLLPLGVTNFVIGSALFRNDPAAMIREIKGGSVCSA